MATLKLWDSVSGTFKDIPAIVGPQGEKGETGETGPTGPVGPTGATGPAGGLASFNGRTGSVLPLAGDYSAAMVGAETESGAQTKADASVSSHDSNASAHSSLFAAKQNVLSGDVSGHYHSADRNRTNHTGTQAASTISDFVATVRSTVLTGLSTATNAVISAADTVLSALGKLQAQITANLASLTAHTGNTSNPHSVTLSQLGINATAARLLAAAGTTAGTSTALTLAQSGFALADGAVVRINLHVASGSAATLNVNSTGTIPIKYANGDALKAGIASGTWLTVIYGATTGNFIVQGDGGDSATHSDTAFVSAMGLGMAVLTKIT